MPPGRFRDVLYAALVSQGLHSKTAQRATLAHAKVHPEESLQAVAMAIVRFGIRERNFPPCVGVRTEELVAIVQETALDRVRHYHDGGGVLTAKGFFQTSALCVAVIAEYWRQFSAPVTTDVRVEPPVEAELRQRTAVAAQEVRDVLLELTKSSEGDSAHTLQGTALENFCVRAAKAALRAFHEPNTVIHERNHAAS